MKHAFTLIELLVVIAIIAILAAILFSVFTQARDKVRQTQRLSNARNIGLAFAQYVQDYDGQFPLAGHFKQSRWQVFFQGDLTFATLKSSVVQATRA